MSQSPYIEYITRQNDTFDQIALRMYHEENLAFHIWEANPDATDVLFFDAGTVLKIPVIDTSVIPETLPPWRR